MILRRVARPLLAAVFVADGLRALRDPRGEIEALPGAERQLEELAARVPYLPANAAVVVRGLGVVKIAAGVALGLGVAPRVAAGVLAALQLPTIVGNHPIWAVPADERSQHVSGLLRDTAVLGGLLLAVGDTEGRPSLAWRVDAARHRSAASAKRAGRSARKELAHAADKAEREAELRLTRAERKVEKAARRAGGHVGDAVDTVRAKAAAVVS